MGLTVITGTMFAGKSTKLLELGRAFKDEHKSIVYAKPGVDTRYSTDEIVTHNNERVQSVIINNQLKGYYPIDEAQVILIDEVQFINQVLIDDIIKLVNEGKEVICAGLDLDWKGNPFDVTQILLANADNVVKLKTMCKCSEPARYSALKQNTYDGQFLLGSDDLYEPLCRTCWNNHQNVNKF